MLPTYMKQVSHYIIKKLLRWANEKDYLANPKTFYKLINSGEALLKAHYGLERRSEVTLHPDTTRRVFRDSKVETLNGVKSIKFTRDYCRY